MSDQVYMNIPEVTGMADTLQKVSETLSAVLKMLDMLLNMLKSTAFIGKVGGAAVIAFIEWIKPMIDEAVRKTAELSSDVRASVTAFQNGDQEGATKFY